MNEEMNERMKEKGVQNYTSLLEPDVAKCVTGGNDAKRRTRVKGCLA